MSSHLDDDPTGPPSASSSSFIAIPQALRRPALPSSASYDSTRSADDEPTPWGGGGGAGSVGSASSPLRGGLASKFASLMARTTGQPTREDDGFVSSLSSEELEQQAREERDRSRREAEALLAMDEQEGGGAHHELDRGAGGTIKQSKQAKVRTRVTDTCTSFV